MTVTAAATAVSTPMVLAIVDEARAKNYRSGVIGVLGKPDRAVTTDVRHEGGTVRIRPAESALAVREVLTEHRDLLRACRTEGIESAFAAKIGLSSNSQGDVPAEVMPILQELGRPAQRADMPRRIRLCDRALRLMARDATPSLWAALQNELANSLG